MNPMSDKLYRDWRANELSREIAHETRVLSALQAQSTEPIHRTARFSIQQWLVAMSVNAMVKVRHFSVSASRPAAH
ncbi:MAG TPA: hypothetical protein VHR64_01645 [Thermomicrobiales bacterium]|nr:hypothetical protein [Thermomicrobiales bacterium]